MNAAARPVMEGCNVRGRLNERRPLIVRPRGIRLAQPRDPHRQHPGGMPVAVAPREVPGRERRHRGRRRTALRRMAWGVSAAALAASLTALVIALTITYQVEGASMFPGLRPGDRVVVDPFASWYGPLRRGEVVVVIPPALPGQVEVKRIIGLPGDQLEVRRPGPGRPLAVYLRPGARGSWRRLSEPYLGSAGLIGCCTSAGRATPDPRPFTVPPHQYFVMGDNRNVSYDSRDYGPVPRSAIRGQVAWLVLPWGQFGPVPIREAVWPGKPHKDV